MIKRLTDIPVYSSTQATIDAEIYNTIRLATQRLPLPIRLSLPRFHYIDLVIDHDSWACVDRSINDLPIVAWTEFDISQRAALHLPLSCKISRYHFQSEQIAEGALTFAVIALEQQLSALAQNSAKKGGRSNVSQLRCVLPAFPPRQR